MFNSCVNFLENQVVNNGDRVAITDKNGSITYNKLREKALQLAKTIGVKSRNKPIVIFLPKSIDCVISFMGVLYTGNFYVPVDIKSPVERLSSLINNLGPVAIVTLSKFADKFADNTIYGGIDLIFIDSLGLPEDAQELDYKSIVANVVETDPIYSIYTSGSTGTPKGVIVSHANVHDFIQWFEETYGVNDETITGTQSPFMFDVSVIDIYMCLKYGSHMHIIPENLFSFPFKLIEYVNAHKINFIVWVPSVLINVANAKTFEKIIPECVEKVLFAGEPMPNKQLNYWRKHLPSVLYSNMYGPTEATVIASYYIVDREFKDSDPLPMGVPCSNTKCFVLSEKGKLIDQNEVGELYIGGTSVAMGYWNDTDATNKAFVQNPLNKSYPQIVYKTGDLVTYNEYGELVYLGRKDSQIKHMGYRIELGEIENSVSNVKTISNSCVLYNKERSEITLFYQSDDIGLSEIDIRKEMTNYLPKYMIPTKFIKLNEWPLNTNGKIDRNKLKQDYLI